MNYQETLDYLFSRLPMYQRVGRSAVKKDLTNITALCSWLNNPQQKFKSIHIAGTNGKGSVAHMLASVLIESGMKVGIYTSPHYVDFRERIKINNEYISEDFVISFVEKYKKAELPIQPSFFELTVAMAFEYFDYMKVDVAIVETGLGGRLDSTNILQPEFSIITNISLDHQQYLGNDLESIAYEKAGIIKIKTPVIVGEDIPETKAVFTSTANERDAVISFTNDLFYTEIISTEMDRSVANIYSFGKLVLDHIELPLSAKYQWKNVILTFHALHLWNDTQRSVIGPEEFKAGIANLISNTKYIVRSKFVKTENCVIGWDSAHNEAGIKVFMEEVNTLDFEQLHILFSAVDDKELESIFDLLPNKAQYYFCKANIPRAMKPRELMLKGEKYGMKGQCFEGAEDAFDSACSKAGKDDLIIICGSIFTIGELMSAGRIA
ncbi:MAG: bifunctional folylpolyglutamate synthase/dihydrofolate synthase [Chitinophagales bacterium]|nr:bifunctional folylpolyglutamate synthase/dihydrofolate synthase [Chitinophagales bacterium]